MYALIKILVVAEVAEEGGVVSGLTTDIGVEKGFFLEAVEEVAVMQHIQHRNILMAEMEGFLEGVEELEVIWILRIMLMEAVLK